MTEEISELVDLPEGGLSRQTARSAPQPRRSHGDGALIVCDNLVKIYKVADLEVVALQGLDLFVEPGEFIALVGASGSGKSTLMNILGGLDVPSAGRAVVAGHVLGEMGRRERTAYRRRVIGFVWQQTARNLLPYLTALQNIELPMLLNGVGRAEREERSASLMARVGLAERGDHRPERLSGGEQQRVAIAVALANEPAVLFADEPTGELDTVTAHQVFDLLRAVNHELGVTIVVVTHDPLVSEQVSRTIAIRDGRTSSETLRRSATTEQGDHHVISEEYAVLDRVGRLQLPRAHVEALGLERRVRLALEPDHISVWPDRDRSGRRRRRRPEARVMRDLQYAPRERRRSDDPSLTPMVETRDLSRDYPMPGGVVHAVRDVSVRVGRGQLIALRGRSGSGKTTLLSMIGALDRPTRGSVSVDGMAVSELPESQLIGFRRRKVGFIFQAFGLMPILSAAENVEVPLRLVRTEPRERDRRVRELLEMVGLGDRANHRPHELSGGEQQRVAIARALANRPPLLLADEPTGQLDSQTGRGIMVLLQHLVRGEGVTAVVATHDPMLIDLADRVIELSDGRVVEGGGPAEVRPAGAGRA